MSSVQDLSSQNMYDAGVALNGLACFVSPDLARDLANDIMTLVSLYGLCGHMGPIVTERAPADGKRLQLYTTHLPCFFVDIPFKNGAMMEVGALMSRWGGVQMDSRCVSLCYHVSK